MPKYLLALLLLLTACGGLDYDALSETGEIRGTVLVMWVGEGNDGAGDGRFVFVPAPGDPLTFVRPEASGNTVAVIQPERMYTDGGSIPRPIQLFNGFSPWGYAPAYIIHDWLFVARHCVNDGLAEGEQMKVADMPFIESAEIIGEVIKALIRTEEVQYRDVAPAAVTSAVAGPISRRLWNQTGRCAADKVSEAHMRQIDAALNPSPRSRILRNGAILPPRPPSVTPARVVRSLSFGG